MVCASGEGRARSPRCRRNAGRDPGRLPRLEWHWIQRLDLWRSFLQQGEIIDKGFVTLTDRPGIGVDMNEETAREAQVPNTPWFMATEGTL